LTLGALAALKKSELVLHTSFSGDSKWLQSLGVANSRNIGSLYKEGGIDRSNYEAMVQGILEAASEADSVAVLISGNPFLGATHTRRLIAVASEVSDLRVEVLPGISSLDTMMIDLRADMLERGCVVLDANRLLLFRFVLDPRLSFFIYHPSSVGNSRTDYVEPWKTNRLVLLRDYLSAQLGQERPFVALCSKSSQEEEVRMTPGKIGDLVEVIEQIDYGTSIYIPESGDLGDVDRDFLRMLLPEA